MKRGSHNEDRLSNCPDGVLHHILSFSNTKQAVQTSLLSTRWKNLWKTLPSLTLSLNDYSCSPFLPYHRCFNTFVSKILSLRDNSASLHVLDLYSDCIIGPSIFQMILNYAFSHNVQRLVIDVHKLLFDIKCKIQQFPPSLFSSDTLTSLKLDVDPHKTLFPNSLNLPALSNLSLHSLIFDVNKDGRVDPFSTLNKLNSLVINDCILSSNKLILFISSVTLVNLSINTSKMKFQLSTPSLCTFEYSGTPLQELCGGMGNLSSVKQVTIYASNSLSKKIGNTYTPLILHNWLINLTNVESLTVSLATLKVLSLVPDLSKIEFPSLYNLKLLKVTYLPSSSAVAKETVAFLLQNAPSAKVKSYLD